MNILISSLGKYSDYTAPYNLCRFMFTTWFKSLILRP